MPANYAPLIALWPSLTGTTAQKIEAVNTRTTAGPSVDVPVSEVIGYLALNLKLSKLSAYAAAPPSGAVAESVTVAQELVALFGMPSAPGFQTSNPAVLAALEGFLAALVSDTANTGITSADQTAILALAATTVPWWSVNGLTSPISVNDLEAADLV